MDSKFNHLLGMYYLDKESPGTIFLPALRGCAQNGFIPYKTSDGVYTDFQVCSAELHSLVL